MSNSVLVETVTDTVHYTLFTADKEHREVAESPVVAQHSKY